MAVDARLYTMCLVSVYKLADEQLYGSSLMHGFRPCVCCLCIRGLMHNRLAVDEWLKTMRLVSVYTQADAQSYGSRCMTLGHAFCVCAYAG